MKEIQNFYLARLHQEESFGFHQLVCTELVKCTDPQFAAALSAYQASLEKFDLALKPAGASPHTKKLTELDGQRDNAYHILAAHVKNMLHHFDPAKAAAALKIHTILRKYGDPVRLPYIEQNGVLINLIQDLKEADVQALLSDIGVLDCLDELERLNAEFISLFSERNLEQSSIVTGLSKEARLQTDEAYKYCAKRLNALAELNGYAVYQPVIDAVNKLTDYEQSVLSARHTRHKPKAEVKN